jgi:chitodextrinase
MATRRPQIRWRFACRPLRQGAILLSLLSCRYDRGTGPPTNPVAAVIVTADRRALAPGDTLQLTAQVLDSGGRVLPTEPVTWTSSTPAVARVDGQGMVIADSVGATTITATAAGKHGSADLAVQVTVLCDCTEIIDSTAVTLVSRDDTTGVYVFRVIRGPPPAADSGTILVGAEAGGYIRRVLRSALVGDLLTIHTAPAFVEEAVRDGAFSATVFSDEESGSLQPGHTWFGPWTTTYLAPGASLTEAGRCCSLNGLGFSQEIIVGNAVAGSYDFIVRQGDIVFSPRVDIGGHIGFFELRDFHVGFRGDLGLNIDLYEFKISLAAQRRFDAYKLEKNKYVFGVRQRPFATFIGPMPLIGLITARIALEITPTISASAIFDGTFRTGFGVAAGVEWSSNDGWEPFSSASSYFQATAPVFRGIEGTASVQIAVVPEFSIQFYGVAGPFVNLEPYALAAASADATFVAGDPTGVNWKTDIAIGLNLNMGAKLSLLGRKDLFEFGFAIPIFRPRQLIRDFSDGPLTVRTVSTGDDIPSTYGVRLRPAFVDTLPLFGIRDLSTSNRDLPMGSTGSALFDDIRSGTRYPHQVTLTDVAANCYFTNPNPAAVAINSDLFIRLGHAATDTVFAVTCIPLGDLRVRTVTRGPNAAPRYFVTVQRQDTVGAGKGDAPLTIGIPGGQAPADSVIEDFIPVNPRRGATGRLSATLTPGRRNCATARPDTNQVVIQSGDTVETLFLVTCVRLGRIWLLAATTDPDPPSASDTIRYAPLVSPRDTVDTVPAQVGSLTAGDSAEVGDLVPLYGASGASGRYTVLLAGGPNRCTDGGSFVRSVTVFPGDTAIADFAVRCVERLHVVTRTTGPGIDPDGYEVVVENADGTADTVPAAFNDTVGIAGVSPGLHTIHLDGVEPSCIAPAPVSQTVSSVDSTLVLFQVSCPAPAPPTGLVATRVDTSRVDLAWDAAPPGSAIAQYRVYRNGTLHDSSTTASFSDAGLTPFTSFVYQVSAVNTNGLEGVRSTPLPVRTRDASPPTTPAALAATAVSASRIDLAWQAAADPETQIAEYLVYRDGTEVGRTTGTTFADAGLAASTTYSYEVSARNGDGLEGSRGAPAQATTFDGTPPTGPPVLTATALSSTRIDLAWQAASDPESGIQGYTVYRDGILAGRAGTTTFTDENLVPNTAYTYTVTAVNGVGVEGPPSPSATATTFPDQTPPTAPTNLSAIAVTSSRIELAWSAASDPESGVTHYRIHRDGALIDSAASPTFADTGLAPATAYRYEVSAVNAAGLEGPRTLPATATTPSTTTGDLVVIAVSSGTGIPAGYIVEVESGDLELTQPIAANGTAVFNGLAPNLYQVRLKSVPGTCSVEGPNPRDVAVTAGVTARTTFVVRCQ